MGLKSESERGGFILGMGIISAFLKASGKIPDFSAQFKISQNGVANSGENSCKIFFGNYRQSFFIWGIFYKFWQNSHLLLSFGHQ